MPDHVRMRRLLVLLTPFLLTSCISYSVGTTARPAPPGTFQQGSSVYFIPNGIESMDDDADDEVEVGLSYASADWQGRWGLSDRSDLSLRIPAGSGVIVTYKRLLNGANDPDRTAISVLAGTGIVN